MKDREAKKLIADMLNNSIAILQADGLTGMRIIKVFCDKSESAPTPPPTANGHRDWGVWLVQRHIRYFKEDGGSTDFYVGDYIQVHTTDTGFFQAEIEIELYDD